MTAILSVRARAIFVRAVTDLDLAGGALPRHLGFFAKVRILLHCRKWFIPKKPQCSVFENTAVSYLMSERVIRAW